MEILGVVEIYSDFEDGIAGDAEVAAEGGHELLSGRLFFFCGKVFSFKKSVIMNRQHLLPCGDQFSNRGNRSKYI